MLQILATILSWEDAEREKAGLQRSGSGGSSASARTKKKEDGSKTPTRRTKEEDETFNEVSNNRYHCLDRRISDHVLTFALLSFAVFLKPLR